MSTFLTVTSSFIRVRTVHVQESSYGINVPFCYRYVEVCWGVTMTLLSPFLQVYVCACLISLSPNPDIRRSRLVPYKELRTQCRQMVYIYVTTLHLVDILKWEV